MKSRPSLTSPFSTSNARCNLVVPRTNSRNESLLARDQRVVLRPWSKTAEPVPIVRAEGCQVFDAEGRALLDFTAGYFVNNLGHCEPRITSAAREQLDAVTQVSGRHTTPAQVGLAERLVETMPDSLDKVLFATGGAEANEHALKLARQRNGRTSIACLENGFHGLTLGVLPTCGSEGYRATAGLPIEEHTVRIPTPYCYRCPHRDDCSMQCLDEAESRLESGPRPAALLAESMQSSGAVVPRPEWWEGIDRLRRRLGLLLILDEIHTGLGRTGRMWAFEHYGLEPDLVTAGKGLSGGIGALSAVVVNEQVAEGFHAGTTPTNAGNAVSAAAGSKMIDLLREEDHIGHARRMGERLAQGLLALDDPWIGEVRFAGLLGGAELVTDRESRNPVPTPWMGTIKTKLLESGFLVTVSGMHGNVLRLQPPLTISQDAIDSILSALAEVLGEVRQAYERKPS